MILLFLIALTIFNKIIYKSYLNPIFLQSLVWLIYYCVLSFNIDSYDIYLFNINKFLLLQTIGFSVGGFICVLFTPTLAVLERQKVSDLSIETTCSNVRLVYPYVLIIIISAIVFIAINSGSLSLFSIMNFRDALAEDDGKKVGAIGTLQLLVSVYVVIYVGTLSIAREGWFKPALLISLFVYFTLLLGTKGQFVSFFCAIGFLLVWQQKISKFMLSLISLFFLAILSLLFFLRAGGEKDSLNEDSLGDLVLIYTVTALPALYLSRSSGTPLFGYYTFRVFYVWLNKFGFSFRIAPVLSEWTVTPLPTNVYSYIMPYYKDFGYWGVFIVPLILGLVHNYFYFRANRGSLLFLVLNALMLYCIITQVWEENYFRQITNWIYMLIIMLLLIKIKLATKKVEELATKF